MAASEAVLTSLISEPGVSDLVQHAPAHPDYHPIADLQVRAVTTNFSQSSEPRDAIPQVFLFGGFYDPAVRLRQPIQLRTERDAAGISVVWDDIAEFGHGETFSEAVEDFGRTIFELYKTLLADDLVLGDDLIDIRRKLDRYISVRPR